MAILLTNGKYYIAHNKSGAIIKTMDIEQAQNFYSIERAIAQKNKCPGLTKGFYFVDTSINSRRNRKSRKYYKTTFYVITDGNKYIGYDKETKKNIVVDNFEDSAKLTYARASNIINCLDKDVLESVEWKIISTIEAEEDLSGALDIDIEGMVDSLEIDFNLLIKRKKVLDLEYLEIEREITDIYHAMEFYDLDAAKGYKLYCMMHERLVKRRKNKDESLKVDYILSGGIKGLTDNSTRQKIERINRRQYQPRVLKELFNV